MKIAKIVVRILFGLLLLIFGLNGFLQFMPFPEMSEQAGKFIGALAETGYIFPIIALLEIIVGVLLLSNKYLALALILIFPIILNAFLFHLFLDIPGIGAALIAIVSNVFLFFTNKENYKNILQMNN